MSVRLLKPPEGMDPTDGIYEYLRIWIDSGKLCASIANPLPGNPEREVEKVWAMIISDIAHHVCDAIVLDTGDYILDVRKKIVSKLSECFKSWRNTYAGKVISQEPKEELNILVQSDDVVEMVRLFHDFQNYHTVVFVGMWQEEKSEETNWGNILYDISTMVSNVVAEEDDRKRIKYRLLEYLLDYIEAPTTESYHGQFRKNLS